MQLHVCTVYDDDDDDEAISYFSIDCTHCVANSLSHLFQSEQKLMQK